MIADEKLVLLIQKGEISAFEILVVRYQQKLLHYVLRIINDRHTAEDIVQESFIKVYKNIGRIDTKRKFSPFLYTVVKNETMTYFRNRRQTVSLDGKMDIIDFDDSIERISRKEEQNKLKKALEALEKKYKEVIKMFYFYDLSYREISKKLKIPVNTVRTNLFRGKKILKSGILHENQKKK